MADQSNHQIPGEPTKQWHELLPERFKEEALLMQEDFPDFAIHNEPGKNVYWTGEAKALRPDGSTLKSLHIKIECAPNYPKIFPRVSDTAGVLNLKTCPHLSKFDGDKFAFCYGNRLDAQLDFEGNARIRDVVSYACVFLAKQWYFERFGYWPGGQAHGVMPFIEYEVKTSSIDLERPCPCGLSDSSYRNCHLPAVQKHLLILDSVIGKICSKAKRFERNDKCPCQSGKKFKKCCMTKINHSNSKAFSVLKFPEAFGITTKDRDVILESAKGNPNTRQARIIPKS
ncbi:MAG: SEC-C domain-containing protein [Minisyncoccia bacterium]|jgi:hypothetical protein